MAKPSPFEFFEAFYQDPLTAGNLALYTTTLRRGKNLTYWCFNLAQADRLCSQYRNTRRVRFGAALQSRKRALKIARERRTGSWLGNARGCEASVTALPALWAEIPYRREAGPDTLPGRRQALGLLSAVEQRPSILVSTGNTFCAFWILDDPWIFDLEDPAPDEKAAAKALLLRPQWAIAAFAAESGWRIPVSADLAASFPVPGSPIGASAKEGRAVLEAFPLLPGDGRYARRDFQSLPEPPAEDPRRPPRGGQTKVRELAVQPRDFRPISAGCSWIRHCLAEGPNLEREELDLAIELLSRCTAPGAGNRQLVGELSEGHPAYDPVTLDRRLAALQLARGEPLSCARIGALPGILERHCAGCPHFGRIESPVELALEDPADCPGKESA